MKISHRKRSSLNRTAALSLSLFALLTGTASAFVIYGTDDRVDVSDITDPRILKMADSTAAMILSTRVNPSNTVSGRSSIDTIPYGPSKRLCTTERFYSYPKSPVCSGFLVGPDLLVTAGHCIESEADCRDYSWVFSFNTKTIHETNDVSVPTSEVYSCKSIITRKLEGDADYALIRLDRKVEGHEPLPIRKTGSVKVGDSLIAIGHPSGLPTIVTPGAKVREVSNPGYFVANLDTYGGNSGSAVLNADTGLVEGILVRGEEDFVFDQTLGCTRSNLCVDSGCRGEDVTRITLLSNDIVLANGGNVTPTPTPSPVPTPSPIPTPRLTAEQIMDSILVHQLAPNVITIGPDTFRGYTEGGFTIIGLKRSKCFMQVRKGARVIKQHLAECGTDREQFLAVAQRYLDLVRAPDL